MTAGQGHRITAVAALAAAAAMLASCGGGSSASVRAPAAATAPAASAKHASLPPDGTLAGVPLQRARCVDWRRAGARERSAAVASLAQIVGGATGPNGRTRGTTLSPGDAARLYASACSTPVARHFLLYELYTRAAGFGSFAHPPD